MTIFFLLLSISNLYYTCLAHEKETHSFECWKYFLQGFGVFSSNTRKQKAKNICIKHLVVSCCMLVCFMAMAQKTICNTIDVATLFWEDVKMRFTLPKWGLGSPLGLLKSHGSIAGVKTPCIGVFFISLESYWSVDIENGLAWAIWTFTA